MFGILLVGGAMMASSSLDLHRTPCLCMKRRYVLEINPHSFTVRHNRIPN